MNTAVYCTAANIESLFSVAGVRNRVDDETDGIGDSALVDDCIEQASADFDMALGQRYSPEVLAVQRWVKWSCAFRAACYVCQRRGLGIPSGWEKRQEELALALERLRDGYDKLPDAPERSTRMPVTIGMHFDRRARENRVRVNPSTTSQNFQPNIGLPTDFDFIQNVRGFSME